MEVRNRQQNLGFGAVGLKLAGPTVMADEALGRLSKMCRVDQHRRIGNIGNERNYIVYAGKSQSGEDAFVSAVNEEKIPGVEVEQKPFTYNKSVLQRIVDAGQDWCAYLRN